MKKTTLNVQMKREELGPFVFVQEEKKYNVYEDYRVWKSFESVDGNYEGFFVEKRGKDGRGSFIYLPVGHLYEGYWSNNKRNGKGRMIFAHRDEDPYIFSSEFASEYQIQAPQMRSGQAQEQK